MKRTSMHQLWRRSASYCSAPGFLFFFVSHSSSWTICLGRPKQRSVTFCGQSSQEVSPCGLPSAVAGPFDSQSGRRIGHHAERRGSYRSWAELSTVLCYIPLNGGDVRRLSPLMGVMREWETYGNHDSTSSQLFSSTPGHFWWDPH